MRKPQNTFIRLSCYQIFAICIIQRISVIFLSHNTNTYVPVVSLNLSMCRYCGVLILILDRQPASPRMSASLYPVKSRRLKYLC